MKFERYEELKHVVEAEFAEDLGRRKSRILDLAEALVEDGCEKDRIARIIAQDFAHVASRAWIYEVLPAEYKTTTKPKREKNPLMESNADTGTSLQSILINEQVQQESKAGAETIRLTRKEWQIIYVEFKDGRTPPYIVAKYGYPFDLVDTEYRKYLKYTLCDIFELERSLITNNPDTINAAGPEAQELARKFYAQGYLSNGDFLELIRLIFKMCRNRR